MDIFQNNITEILPFLVVSSADHITGVPGLVQGVTMTVTLSKNGGAWLAPVGAIIDDGEGDYHIAPNAADADTPGPLRLRVRAAGCDPVDIVVADVLSAALAVPASSASLVVQLEALTGLSLSAAQWSEVAAQALRLYSRHRPAYALGTFTTTANQEEYTLPAGAYLCLAVSPQGAAADLMEEVTGYPWEQYVLASGDYFVDWNYPSLTEVFRQRLNSWTRQYEGTWAQDQEGGPVRLIPRPTEAQAMAWYYTVPHADFATVPAGDADLLIAAGRIAVYDAAAGAALASVTGDAAEEKQIGPVRYRRGLGALVAASNALREQAATARAEFTAKAYRAASALKG